MSVYWQLHGTPLLVEATAEDYQSGAFGGYARMIADPDRFGPMLLAYDGAAAAWPEAMRRRFCDTMPTLELAPDLALAGDIVEIARVTLVTAPLRRLFEEAGCDAAYAPVVGRAVAPGVWFTFWPRRYADPIDRARTPGRPFPVDLPDGTVGEVWQQVYPDPMPWPPPRTRYLEGFDPGTPLFRTAGTGWTMVTDGLGERILRRFPAVELQDVMSEHGQSARVLKPAP